MTIGQSGSDLCLACGLCCDGTLFQHGTLVEGEVDWALAQGFSVVRGAGGAPAFRQPCPGFRDGCCSVYDGRPTTCRAFRCRLLDDVDAGRVGLDEALAVVGEARAAQRDLEQRLGLPAGSGNRRRLARKRLEAVRGDDLDAAEAVAEAAAPLDALLAERFGKPE